jgi:hypothetical protein
VWTELSSTGRVLRALQERCAGWADVRRVPFEVEGADVREL